MEIQLNFFLLISSALLALVSSECTKFEFNPDDRDEYSQGTNPYVVAREMYRVSTVVNCTSQLAQSVGGDDNDTCGFHRYSMGLRSEYTSPLCY